MGGDVSKCWNIIAGQWNTHTSPVHYTSYEVRE